MDAAKKEAGRKAEPDSTKVTLDKAHDGDADNTQV
jgi:hypothetical protein